MYMHQHWNRGVAVVEGQLLISFAVVVQSRMSYTRASPLDDTHVWLNLATQSVLGRCHKYAGGPSNIFLYLLRKMILKSGTPRLRIKRVCFHHITVHAPLLMGGSMDIMLGLLLHPRSLKGSNAICTTGCTWSQHQFRSLVH